MKLLEDVKCSIIALVKSPANATYFYVVKGGDCTVNDAYIALADICKGEELSAFEKRSIPEDQQDAVGKAVLALKSAYGDLPEGIQEAIRVLLKSSLYNFAVAEKSAEAVEEKVSDSELKDAILDLSTKLGVSAEKNEAAVDGVVKSVVDLAERISKLEKSSDVVTSVEPPKKKEEVTKDAGDTWAGAIPDEVIAGEIVLED